MRIMMKQWLLAPHFGFASDDSRQLGTKSSHMDLPDIVWFPFDEAELDEPPAGLTSFEFVNF